MWYSCILHKCRFCWKLLNSSYITCNTQLFSYGANLGYFPKAETKGQWLFQTELVIKQTSNILKQLSAYVKTFFFMNLQTCKQEREKCLFHLVDFCSSSCLDLFLVHVLDWSYVPRVDAFSFSLQGCFSSVTLSFGWFSSMNRFHLSW